MRAHSERGVGNPPSSSSLLSSLRPDPVPPKFKPGAGALRLPAAHDCCAHRRLPWPQHLRGREEAEGEQVARVRVPCSGPLTRGKESTQAAHRRNEEEEGRTAKHVLLHQEGGSLLC